MAKKTKTKKRITPSRPKPLVPKAGPTLSKRRYGCGGKIKK